MCVCHPSFEDHNYRRGSRQARCLFSMSTMPQKWSDSTIRSSVTSLGPSVFASSCLEKQHRGLLNGKTKLIRPSQCKAGDPHIPQKPPSFICYCIHQPAIFFSLYSVLSALHIWSSAYRHAQKQADTDTHARQPDEQPRISSSLIDVC